ncbi:hypothetical protein acdb102_28510 [Acidothermaceae bacterium B102]|nr:hypothetical protein acdb102_28510 [Acidothermaceae bacterium B102]
MSRSPRRPRSRFCTRLLPVAGAAAVGIAVTGGAVYAALTATAFNTSAQTVTSSTLSLTYANNGVGWPTTITNMAPTDVVNRYVNLTNGAGLNAINLTLGVADATTTALTSDATKGLAATVSSCPIAWVPATGTCVGGATVILASTPLATLKTTPGTLAATVAANAVLYLQVSLTLPASTEVTANGTPPGSTIQGLSAALTWTFTEQQRAGTTTNS